jgi:hypoxanthine phosphoribosyltransferase
MTYEKRDVPVLFSADEIRARVRALSLEIASAMPQDFVMVSLLRGSFVFTADLIRELYVIGVHPQIDFLTLSSYGRDTTSGKQVNLNRDITEQVRDRDVLIVDDILESGRTLHFARNLLTERGAASIKIVALLEKPGKRELQIDADFLGFNVPDKFVVGYGLDYANHYRELPYIGYIEVH